MKWKAEAVEKLRKYDAMRQAVLNIPEEITRLNMEAKRIRAAGVNPRGGQAAAARRENMLLDNFVQRQNLELALREAELWLQVTERAMGVLSPEERLVLTRFFIYPERGGVDRLCGELGVEQSSIYRRRDKALHRFMLAMYGAAEN